MTACAVLLASCGGGGESSGTDSRTATAAVNQIPSADAGADHSVNEHSPAVLDGSASRDPDGSIASYAWRQVSGQTVAISNAEQATSEFTAPEVAPDNEDLVFELTVRDNDGATAKDSVTVSIVDVNLPPVADAGADRTVESESPVDLTAVASADADGRIVSYRWAQVEGPAVELGDAAAPEVSFTAPRVSTNTLLQFELTIVDDAGTSATDTVDVTVTPPLFDIAGTLTLPERNLVDSDVNDPNAPYAANDTPDTAQLIPNPATVGGYANRKNEGSDGRSRPLGDRSDYYRVVLTAGQTVTAHLGDTETGDLDLYLWDLSGTRIIDASLSLSATESVVVPGNGEYLLEIYAFSGASNYVLNVGATASTASPEAVSSKFGLQGDFVPYEAIVRYRDASAAAHQGHLKPNPASMPRSMLSVRKLSGETTRPMLYALRPDFTASSQAAGFGGNEMDKRRAAVGSEGRRDKWETLIAIKMLAQDAGVRYAEPNYIRRASAIPTDRLYDRQWHYPFINLPEAWDITMGDPAVTVAVIDTGVLVDHPDLQGALVGGYDFISSTSRSNDGDGIDPDPGDPGDGCGDSASSFHGTHVTGTVAAATNNTTGVAGVAGGSTIMPLRVLGCDGGTTYDIGQAVLFAAGLANDSGIIAEDPADIINLSLGGSDFSQTMQDVYTAARNAGVITVAAAGNDATSRPHYPAGYDGVVSVSALGIDGVRADYSNYGPATDIAAPGGAQTGDANNDGFADLVYSTVGREDPPNPLELTYGFMLGTSMATPHVAGVLALMKSVNADIGPADIDAMLIRGDLVTDIGSAGWDEYYGWGLIDARKAVTAAVNAIGNPPSESPALDVSPRTLDLGAFTSTVGFEVTNAGGGELIVGGITTDPGATWLSVAADSVDVNGVGTYTVTADRTGLAEGSYTASVDIASNANTFRMQATLIVPPAESLHGDAGRLYVVLIDSETRAALYGGAATRVSGVPQFTVTGVPEGTYEVIAGSDSNNDFYICDGAESCGRYPEFGNAAQVTITNDTANIDFPVDYAWFLPAEGTGSATGTATAVPAARTP